MLIDWFTVGAQTLNFLVLVWLLKRFLYQPILDAIDARARGIAGKLAEAEASKTEALLERAEFSRKNEQFEQQRAAMLAEAGAAAGAERQRLLDEARQVAATLQQRYQNALDSERQGLVDALARRTRDEVFAIARQLLQDLASATLEEGVTAMFTRRLRALDGEPRATLLAALREASGPVVLHSAFALPTAQQDQISAALSELAGRAIAPVFELAPDLISGVELRAGGQKLSWSIAAYLGSLEQGVAELVEARGQGGQPSATLAPAPAPVLSGGVG